MGFTSSLRWVVVVFRIALAAVFVAGLCMSAVPAFASVTNAEDISAGEDAAVPTPMSLNRFSMSQTVFSWEGMDYEP